MKKSFIIFVFLLIGSSYLVSAQTDEKLSARQKAVQEAYQARKELKASILEKSLTEDVEVARVELKQLVRAREGSDYWYWRYGDLLLQMAIKQVENGQYEKGVETAGESRAAYETAIQKISKQNPERKAKALVKLAYVQDRFFGEKAAALEILKEAEKLDADNSEIQKRLARVQAKLSTEYQ